jgi:hypothetical protein
MRKSIKVPVEPPLIPADNGNVTLAVRYYGNDKLYCSGCSIQLVQIEIEKKKCMICQAILLSEEELHISLYKNPIVGHIAGSFDTNPCLELITNDEKDA